MSVQGASGSEYGRITFEFETSCSADCEFYFMTVSVCVCALCVCDTVYGRLFDLFLIDTV